MSEDKSTEKMVDNIAETVEEVVDDITETVEEVVDDIKDAIDEAKPPLVKLKEENPKVFYGGIAAVVAVLGFFFLSGDSSSKKHTQAALSVGQTYTLSAPNAVGETSLKILKIPGSMASFDNPDDVVCSVPSGTPAIARNFQDAFATTQLFVQVELVQAAGDCRAGVKGWTLKNNLR